MGIIYFILMIGVLVLVHELGHYVAARKFRVRVKQFAVGMGPRIAGFKRGNTDFRISLLPIGGYVMMEEKPDPDDVRDDGEFALSEIAIWKRAVVAFAGPFFSLALPVFCYLFVGIASSTAPATVIGAVAEEGPAAEAGLLAGDEIVSLDGVSITYWHELQERVVTSEKSALEVEFVRDGETHHTVVDVADVGGKRRMGVSLYGDDGAPPEVEFPWSERAPYAISYAFTEPFRVGRSIVVTLGGFATGQTSSKELGGPLMIFDVSKRAGEAGWRAFLIVMAVISLNLGLINLLPIPVLDGGRLMLLGVEAVQRRPLSARTQQITAYVGIAMVVGLMVLAFKNDIERYWSSFL